MKARTVIEIIQEKANEPSGGRLAQAQAVASAKSQLLTNLRISAHNGLLNDFNAYMIVVNMVTGATGVFTTDLYEMADIAHRLAWLGDLLRDIEEPFVLACQP